MSTPGKGGFSPLRGLRPLHRRAAPDTPEALAGSSPRSLDVTWRS